MNRRTFGRRNVLGPRRLGCVFLHKVHVEPSASSAGRFGEEPLCEKEDAEDAEGRDGSLLYASDHLGVCVRLHLRRMIMELKGL